MPLYEYECQDCGEVMEILQSHGERPKRKCPDCGGRLKKAVSAPAFQFKGTGWYVTDYADKKGSGKKGSDDAKPEKASSSDSKADDKPKKKKPKSSD